MAGWYLLRVIYCGGDTVVAADAKIVLMATSVFPSHNVPNYCKIERRAMSQRKGADKEIYQAIFEVVRQVPNGRVTTYGAVAAALGAASGARLVGYALHGCGPTVPSHRVVNAKGLLTGKHHFSPPEAMQQRLEQEGIEVRDDQVVRFKELFWDPLKEIVI
jgi:methylated-DNA-protein-cysteine methyltransferase related protein